jgi:hypothetical protein
MFQTIDNFGIVLELFWNCFGIVIETNTEARYDSNSIDSEFRIADDFVVDPVLS